MSDSSQSHGGQSQGSISGWRLAAFSILALAIGGVQTPLVLYLPPYYSQQVGIHLALVGTAFMVSRIWNAVIDPLIGIASDRTRSRIGRRRPYVLGGSALALVMTPFVFMPPQGVGPVYLFAVLFVFYLGLSMLSTPLYAWAGDLSSSYHERTRIQTYVQTASSIGAAMILLIPVLLERFGTSSQSTKVAAMGWFLIAVIVIGVPALLFSTPERARPVPKQTAGVAEALRLLATDPMVLRVMGSDFFVTLGQFLRGSVLVFFVSQYMGLGQSAFFLPFLQYGFGILASPIWARVGYRFGKSRTVLIAEGVQIVICLALLGLAPGQLGWLAFLTIAQGLAQGSGNLMLRAIVTDVADHQRLVTGRERGALLFSIFNVTGYAAMGVAVGVSYPVLGLLFGFVPGGQNSEAAIDGLRWAVAVGPATGHFLSALLMWRFPLNEARHAANVRALDAVQGRPTEDQPGLAAVRAEETRA